MAASSSENALLLIDFINEIVHPDGKIAGKGYADFDARHGSLDRVGALLRHARRAEMAVIHVGVAFSADYREQPEASPVFGGAKRFGVLQRDTWATDFHVKATPLASEAALVKHRVSAFFGTPLELLLRTYGVRNLFIAGCATDMAVQTATRDAHDRDFACHVLGDCCIAANDDDHEQTLRMLVKVARIMTLDEFVAS
jgi:nicotinamidase-related amidase